MFIHCLVYQCLVVLGELLYVFAELFVFLVEHVRDVGALLLGFLIEDIVLRLPRGI